MAALPVEEVEIAEGPDNLLVKDFMSIVDGYVEDGHTFFLPGDKFGFPGLKEKPGLKFVSAIAERNPKLDKNHEDYYKFFNLKLRVTINGDKSVYSNDSDSKIKLLNDIKDWFYEAGEDNLKISDQQLIGTNSGPYEVSVSMLLRSYRLRSLLGEILDSSFLQDFWNKQMGKIVKEGVCYVKGRMPASLKEGLKRHLDDLARKTPIDYHPNSNNTVRDLVHPALIPYIKGISKLHKSAILSQERPVDDESDFWGRKYEESIFQWLPTRFQITNDGKCVIQNYINNLDQDRFPDLYRDMESLFEMFLPFFEEVWSYSKAMTFFKGDLEDDTELEELPSLEKEAVSFNGQELQVIVKIVEYTLEPGQEYEGVWHAEGMSHENIVMTGIFFLDRAESIHRGDLQFKRAFTLAERNMLFWNIPQQRPAIVNTFASEGFMPLGHFATEEGYLIVFPNCHIHKISNMINASDKQPARRRIIVFFIVNPEKKIVSTDDVPPQQNIIPLNSAKQYRLQLMEERRYDKDKLNVRDIELCEH